MTASNANWADAWGEGEETPQVPLREPTTMTMAPTSARVAAATPPAHAYQAEDVEAILMELARLRADLTRRDAITIVVVGVLLTAILQHIARMHEEFNMMASRVGILR